MPKLSLQLLCKSNLLLGNTVRGQCRLTVSCQCILSISVASLNPELSLTLN